MTRKTALVAIVPTSTLLFVVWLAVLAGPVDAQGLYDDFSGKSLEPSKWSGVQLFGFTGVSAGTALELTREIVGGGPHAGYLNMAHRVVGSPFANPANPGRTIGRNRLQFFTSQIFEEVMFDIKVLDFEAVGCPNPGSETSRARARYVGSLFNDPSTPGPGVTGNVGVIAELSRESSSTDEADVLRARGFVFRCPDAVCLFSVAAGIDLGPVSRGTQVTLRAAWDALNNKVDFQLNDGPIHSIDYSQAPFFITDDSNPPKPQGLIGNSLEVRMEAANCTAVIGTTRAEMNALFDNVFVTPKAP